MSLAGVSPRLIEYHGYYLTSIDDVYQRNDIVISFDTYLTINNNYESICNIL